MTRIKLNAEMQATLKNLTEPLELCSEDGRIVAHLVPHLNMERWEPITPDITDEELDEIEKSDDWHTTAEVLAHLRHLEHR